ncbi:hypothetical protein [Pseudarthrobacter phenanthrenivorans]|nr:hypothetical protein [Pseudarthrobacter phenanthrenivorans]
MRRHRLIRDLAPVAAPVRVRIPRRLPQALPFASAKAGSLGAA